MSTGSNIGFCNKHEIKYRNISHLDSKNRVASRKEYRIAILNNPTPIIA